MENLKNIILLAILIAKSVTVNSICSLENLGKDPCSGRLQCTVDFGEATSLVQDWACRRHETYDYNYRNYRRVRIDEDYNLYVTGSQIHGVDLFRPYSAISELSDHIVQISVTESEVTTVPSAILSLPRTTSIDLSINTIESLDLGSFSRRNLKELNVSHNMIASLDVGDMSPGVSEITSIDLSHNAIKSIPNNYFRQCPDLLHLNLSYNSIESVDILTFEGITQLETLSMSNNRISKLGLYLARFVHLKELFLANNNLVSIEEGNLNMMTSLTTLDLSSNRLASIDSSSFQLLLGLTSLDISNNKMELLPKTLFAQNAHLSFLDLSNNSISKLEPGSFEGKMITDFRIQNNKLSGRLEQNTFQGIYVEDLDVSNANITELGPSLFESLNTTMLSINFSRNSICKIDKTTFSKLELLTSLDLSHNKINNIEFDMTDLKNLSYLQLNDNSVQNITQNTFKGLVSLKKMDLSNNDISEIETLSFEDLNDLETLLLDKNPLPLTIVPQMFSGLTSCVGLHLTNTKINSLQDNAFNGMDSLTTLNVSRGDLKNVQFNTFNGTGSVETLDLSFNKIENFAINNSQISFVKNIHLNNNRLRFVTNETFMGLINLNLLDLRFNNIVRIENEAFRTLTNVQTLLVSANENMLFNSSIFSNVTSLETVLLKNVTAKFTFQNLINTSISGLDISFCEIVDVNSVQLYKIETLERLKLSWNKIRSIDKLSFQKLRHLSWIDLSHNKISNIQPGSFSDLLNLNTLKLNDNYLTTLQFGILDGLIYLRVIFLSNNILRNCNANIFHNTNNIQEVYLDNNVIEDINFSDFVAANLSKISIGGNPISCDRLTEFKKVNLWTELTVTTEKLNYDTENVDGITCKSRGEIDNIPFASKNATVLTATLLNTIEQFKVIVERLLNRNESREHVQKVDFEDVSTSIEQFLKAFNKTETSNNIFLGKLIEINNSTNWHLGNIQKILKEHGNASSSSHSGAELKDKDIEKILSGMLEEQRNSLRLEFKGMLDDMKSHSVGFNQFASQTASAGSSTDLKSALYFIATCLATLLGVMVLIFIFIYFKLRSNRSSSNSLYNSRQPIANVMEME